jgi:hypothetical protein
MQRKLGNNLQNTASYLNPWSHKSAYANSLNYFRGTGNRTLNSNSRKAYKYLFSTSDNSLYGNTSKYFIGNQGRKSYNYMNPLSNTSNYITGKGKRTLKGNAMKAASYFYLDDAYQMLHDLYYQSKLQTERVKNAEIETLLFKNNHLDSELIKITAAHQVQMNTLELALSEKIKAEETLNELRKQIQHKEEEARELKHALKLAISEKNSAELKLRESNKLSSIKTVSLEQALQLANSDLSRLKLDKAALSNYIKLQDEVVRIANKTINGFIKEIQLLKEQAVLNVAKIKSNESLLVEATRNLETVKQQLSGSQEKLAEAALNVEKSKMNKSLLEGKLEMAKQTENSLREQLAESERIASKTAINESLLVEAERNLETAKQTETQLGIELAEAKKNASNKLTQAKSQLNNQILQLQEQLSDSHKKLAIAEKNALETGAALMLAVENEQTAKKQFNETQEEISALKQQVKSQAKNLPQHEIESSHVSRYVLDNQNEPEVSTLETPYQVLRNNRYHGENIVGQSKQSLKNPQNSRVRFGKILHRVPPPPNYDPPGYKSNVPIQPVNVAQNEPIHVAQNEPVTILQNEPINVAQNEPINVVQNEHVKPASIHKQLANEAAVRVKHLRHVSKPLNIGTRSARPKNNGTVRNMVRRMNRGIPILHPKTMAVRSRKAVNAEPLEQKILKEAKDETFENKILKARQKPIPPGLKRPKTSANSTNHKILKEGRQRQNQKHQSFMRQFLNEKK